MNEEFLKTGITALIAEKNTFNNMFIVSASATIGLIIKALTGKAATVEIFFIFAGIIFVLFIFKRINYYSQKIRFLLFELKKEK